MPITTLSPSQWGFRNRSQATGWLRTLRSLTVVDANTGQPRLSLATNATDAALFRFRVALSLMAFLRSPQRQRLKLCANPGCGFAFVDTSINATRRWCDMRYRGNRLKVRAFRRRQTPRRHMSARRP